MKTTGCVYCLRNKIDGKCYVGLSTDYKKRLENHWCLNSDCLYLTRAIKRHGKDSFTFEILEDNIPVASLYEREMFWIVKLESKAPNGYNCTDGGHV